MAGVSLSDALKPNGIGTEFEGGVYVNDLPAGAILEIETERHRYTIVNHIGGHALISGHPTFCPEPIPVRIEGSTWGGSMVKLGFIGLGMHLTFRHPTYHTITTSRIVEIRATSQTSNS
jgi:hypothetical protein